MAGSSLKALLRPRSEAANAVTAVMAALDGPLSIEDAAGNVLLGQRQAGVARVAVASGDAALGFVTGPRASAEVLASLLRHLAAKEAERRALGDEVLHLYREIHLIDQLSEQLAALLDISAVCESALAQARRLIAATSGGILVREKPDEPLRIAAMFGDAAAVPQPESDFVASVVERGVAEIVNVGAMVADAVSGGARPASNLRSLIFAPLRAKQRTVGLVALTNDSGEPYAAADLKLLNTIALQTAAAIESSLMAGEMVDAARYREQL